MLTRYTFFKTFLFILFLSTLLYISYQPLDIFGTPDVSPKAGVVFSLYSFGDLDQELCKKNIKQNRKTLFNSSTMVKCPKNEKFVSITCMSRTGNLMWAYASVMAIAQQTGLKAYIPSCIKSNLDDIFENLTLPTFKEIIQCPVKIDGFVESIDDWKINPQSIILSHYLIYPKEIMPWIPNIWQEFRLKKNLIAAAQQTLNNLTKNLPFKNYTFVGVHVRRTDYKDYLRRKYKEDLASPQFFLNAMTYFKQKYPDPVFIFVSDDPQWCIEKFSALENVFVATDTHNKTNSAALDLAILVACNHTIYDYGTFGEWGAILAGGEAVCYDMIQNSKEGSMQYNSSWHLMS